jgi:hypothetical protein
MMFSTPCVKMLIMLPTALLIGCAVPNDGDVRASFHRTKNHQLYVVEVIRRLKKDGWTMPPDVTCSSIIEKAIDRKLLSREGYGLFAPNVDGWGNEMKVICVGEKCVIRSFGFNGKDDGGKGDDIDKTLDE